MFNSRKYMPYRQYRQYNMPYNRPYMPYIYTYEQKNKRGKIRKVLYFGACIVLIYAYAWQYIPYDTFNAIGLAWGALGVGYVLGRH